MSDETNEQRFKRIYIAWYRGETLSKHKRDKASWPWYGRVQHWLFCSWRCPACKALRSEGGNDGR